MSVLRARAVLLVLVALLTFGSAPVAGAKNDSAQLVDVQILATNDIHGQVTTGRTVGGRPIGGIAYLAAYMDQLDEEHTGKTIRVDVGDTVGASPPVSALLQDEPTIAIMNAMGFDVSAVGNHEFDEGLDELFRLYEGGCHPVTEPLTGCFEGTDFPRLAANVVYESTGEPILAPYEIVKVQGVEIAFIGVVTTDTPNIVVAGAVDGLVFLDEAETINRYVEELTAQGIETIVVLAHSGGFRDRSTGDLTGEIAGIANAVDDEVDVIASAHTHQGYVATVDGKLVTQAYSYTTAVADIRLQIDRKTGDVVAKEATIVSTWNDAIEPDARIAEMVAEYEELVGPIINEVIGVAADDITRDQSAAGESELGNLIADAQRWQTGTDFAFMNPGGIRADIAAGEVTWGELFTVQPFANDLVTMNLTGQQIYDLLNQQWQTQSDGSVRVRFLQISGLSYTWDPNAPIGDRIVEVRDAGGAPLDPSASYSVTVNSFLAGGGDSFTVLLAGTDRAVGVVDLEALVAYIEQLPQPFNAAIEGRISVASES